MMNTPDNIARNDPRVFSYSGEHPSESPEIGPSLSIQSDGQQSGLGSDVENMEDEENSVTLINMDNNSTLVVTEELVKLSPFLARGLSNDNQITVEDDLGTIELVLRIAEDLADSNLMGTVKPLGRDVSFNQIMPESSLHLIVSYIIEDGIVSFDDLLTAVDRLDIPQVIESVGALVALLLNMYEKHPVDIIMRERGPGGQSIMFHLGKEFLPPSNQLSSGVPAKKRSRISIGTQAEVQSTSDWLQGLDRMARLGHTRDIKVEAIVIIEGGGLINVNMSMLGSNVRKNGPPDMPDRGMISEVLGAIKRLFFTSRQLPLVLRPTDVVDQQGRTVLKIKILHGSSSANLDLVDRTIFPLKCIRGPSDRDRFARGMHIYTTSADLDKLPETTSLSTLEAMKADQVSEETLLCTLGLANMGGAVTGLGTKLFPKYKDAKKNEDGSCQTQYAKGYAFVYDDVNTKIGLERITELGESLLPRPDLVFPYTFRAGGTANGMTSAVFRGERAVCDIVETCSVFSEVIGGFGPIQLPHSIGLNILKMSKLHHYSDIEAIALLEIAMVRELLYVILPSQLEGYSAEYRRELGFYGSMPKLATSIMQNYGKFSQRAVEAALLVDKPHEVFEVTTRNKKQTPLRIKPILNLGSITSVPTLEQIGSLRE